MPKKKITRKKRKTKEVVVEAPTTCYCGCGLPITLQSPRGNGYNSLGCQSSQGE